MSLHTVLALTGALDYKDSAPTAPLEGLAWTLGR